jgi:hypothetical protein
MSSSDLVKAVRARIELDRESLRWETTAVIFEAMLAVVEAQEKFNAKFSPGENWYPEFETALAALREAVKE